MAGGLEVLKNEDLFQGLLIAGIVVWVLNLVFLLDIKRGILISFGTYLMYLTGNVYTIIGFSSLSGAHAAISTGAMTIGMNTGAAIGATIGSVIPIAGTAAGGIVGTAAGGIVGAAAGFIIGVGLSIAGNAVFDMIYDNTVGKEVTKITNDVVKAGEEVIDGVSNAVSDFFSGIGTVFQ